MALSMPDANPIKKIKSNTMSKIQKIKEQQGYNPKPVFPTCSNCTFFQSKMIKNEYNYTEEKDIRCGLGNFVVKKNSTCTRHSFKNLDTITHLKSINN